MPSFKMRFIVPVLALAASCSALAAEPSSPVREVVVVFKTHFDIGYTDLAANIVQRYRTTMIDQALAVADASRALPPEQQFVWTLPGWPLAKIMEDWPGQTPARRQRLMRAFGEGRFVVHALPFTTHTETLDLEDLVRGMSFASALSRQAGKPLPRDAKMTDVPCHSWVMPTLLAHAGVDFLHLGCNAASSSPRVPPLFWWEGADGSRVLTMYSAAGYGTGLAPPKDWPHATWLALIHTGDNHGPPTPAEVKALLDDAGKKLPGVAIRIGRLSDFADAILRAKPELPVVRGDMPDTWIHGPMCDPAGAKTARNVRPALAAAESLDTLMAAWGAGGNDQRGKIAAAYENSLLYGEHTWGGALYWLTSYAPGKVKFGYGDVFKTERAAGRFNRIEASWDEHSAYIENTRKIAEPLLAERLKTLAAVVQVDGPRLVVFNPLPRARSGVVDVAWAGPTPQGMAAADRAVQAAVACKVVAGRLRFFAQDVPPLGYRTFVPAAAQPAVWAKPADPPNQIESPHFRAVLDPAKGAIASLVDLRSGRELVDAKAEHGFGQYLYERFDADQVRAYNKAYTKIAADWALNELGKPQMPSAREVPYRAAGPKNCTLRIEEDAVAVTAVMEAAASAELPHRVTTRLILYRNQPQADVEVTLHDKPADNWPEAGWLCLPLVIDSPRFKLGRQSSIVDPAADLVPGSNHDLFWLNTGLAVHDGQGRGVGLYPLDHALVSLERPGCWRYSPEFTPRKSAVFINLFNNQWTTNFRMWNAGTWTSRVRLWAFDRYTPSSALVAPACDARSPLLAATADGPGGKLPARCGGVEIGRDGVMVTALGPNPDGPGRILRLWELAGVAGDCQVRLPPELGASKVQRVNLRGQPAGEPLPVVDGAVTVPLRAFAPVTLLLP
jgi:hypothetical protein